MQLYANVMQYAYLQIGIGGINNNIIGAPADLGALLKACIRHKKSLPQPHFLSSLFAVRMRIRLHIGN